MTEKIAAMPRTWDDALMRMVWFDGLPRYLRDVVNELGPYAETAICAGFNDPRVIRAAVAGFLRESGPCRTY